MDTKSFSYSPYDYLPQEIWLKIFVYLRTIDLLRIRLVCNDWKRLSTHKTLAKKMTILLDDDKYPPKELRRFVTAHPFNHLPVYRIKMTNIQDSDSLKYVLRSFKDNIRSVILKDAKVFKTLSKCTKASSIQEVQFIFSNPELSEICTDMSFLTNYKYLTDLNITCEGSTTWLGVKVLKSLASSQLSSLRHFHATYCDSNELELYRFLSRNAHKLKELELQFNDTLFGSDEWRSLFAKLKNLKILKISKRFPEDVFDIIFKNLPCGALLRDVEFEGVINLDDIVLTYVINMWDNSLKELTITFNSEITGAGLAEIWKLHNCLEKLAIIHCYSLTFSDVRAAIAVETNFNLRELCLAGIKDGCEEDICKIVQNLPNLEVLDLNSHTQGITNKVLAYIFRYQTNLRKLVLDHCYGFNDDGIYGLGEPHWPNAYPINRLRKLEELSLEGCQKLRRDFTDCLFLPTLRTLNLAKLRHLKSPDFCKIVNFCRVIEVLDLAFCDGLDERAFYYICQNLNVLYNLNIEHCSRLKHIQFFQYAKYVCQIRIVKFGEGSRPKSAEEIKKELKEKYLAQLEREYDERQSDSSSDDDSS